MSIRLKILKKMYSYSKRQLLNEIKKEDGVNLRCVNCNTWEHENLLDGYPNEYASASDKGEEFGYRSVCGRCGHVSYWNCGIAPVPISCDHTGMPIADNFVK